MQKLTTRRWRGQYTMPGRGRASNRSGVATSAACGKVRCELVNGGGVLVCGPVACAQPLRTLMKEAGRPGSSLPVCA